MKRQIILEIIYFLLILLFTYASFIKLLDLEKFQSQMSQSTIISPYKVFLSWMVPVSELITVVMLLIPRLRAIGLYTAFALMSSFCVYIVLILNFEPNVPCSCGGILEHMGWYEHLGFNLAFVAMIILAIFLQKQTDTRRYEKPTI